MPVVGGTEWKHTVVATASSTASTITIPSSVLPGDILLLLDAPTTGSAVSPTVPSGFTQLAAQGFAALSFTSGVVVSARIAVAGLAGTSISGMNGSTNAKFMYVLRSDYPAISISAAKNYSGVSSTSNPIGPYYGASTSVVGPAVVVGFAAANNAVSIPWEGYYPSNLTTPAFDSNNEGVKLTSGVSTIAQSGTSFTQAVDMNDFGSNHLGVFWFEVR